MKLSKRVAVPTVASLFLALSLPAAAQTGTAVPTEAWAWRVGLNGWFPSVHSSTQLDLPNGGNISAETDPGSYLSKLKFAFMGTLEARRGPWSFLADALYLNIGDLRSKVRSISGPTGIVTVPIDAGTRSDLKGFIGTFEGGYAMMQTPGARADVVAGVRYASLKTKLDWQLSGPTGGLATEGGVEATKDFLDGVVGVRGNTNLGDNWDFRYYVDAGAGSSRFTWQALAGVGYRFSWGDAVLGYRHLAYEFHNDRPISDVKFSGPQIEVGFKF
jgi:opacity protein-like surface antigen